MDKVLNLTKNRLLIIFKDKVIVGLFLFITIFFTLVVSTLVQHADEGSKLPIAVVDVDNSELSNKLLDNLHNHPSLNVYIKSEKEANKMLKDATIEAVFTIKEGYEESIQNLELDELITVTYLEGSTAGKIISDIYAGEMLYDICMYKAQELLEKSLDDRQAINKDEVMNTFDEYIKERQRKYIDIIDISFVDLGNEDIVDANIDNSLIYKQIIMGLMATFISFLLLFGVNSIVRDKELGINSRLKIVANSHWAIVFSNLISVFIVGLVIAIVLSLLIFREFQLYDINSIINFISLFIAFIFAMTGFLLMIAEFIDRVVVLQICGGISLLIFGIIGSSVWNQEFINQSYTKILGLVPNSWFVEGMTNILVANNNVIIQLPTVILFGFGIVFLSIIFINQKFTKKA